jgi:Family of unknown function (DUF5715)
MTRRIVLILLLFTAAGVAVWAAIRYVRPRIHGLRANDSTAVANSEPPDSWAAAVEQAKADRGEPAGVNARAETPSELKHYSDRHWFLATQVAEVAKHKLDACQDYLDLAAMIQRGEIVTLPAVTDSYVLFGIGERASDEEFSRYEDDPSVEPNELYDETKDQQKLSGDYEALRALAENFDGRTYDIDNPTDRQAMKIHMLSSLRPAALKILEEVASAYHLQFGRRLPVSSLVRPEQYQRALRRVNRNAILIDTPPHSTGLAFDIDFRYMSGAEQTFVMNELARIKREGRIEVIRERNANYHVFAFIDGTRPPDDLVTASLEEARGPVQQAHHAPKKATSKKVTRRSAKARKTQRPRANVRQIRRRRR